tara:strand:+ start:1086 stop:1226 length:141 start_codon:yes stop_codon:yes gene_type:complete
MTHPTLETDEARQAERKPGMFVVLSISVALAAIAVGIIYTVTATGG